MPVADYLVSTYKRVRPDHGPAEAGRLVQEVVRESVRQKKFRLSEFSIRGAAEAACGTAWPVVLGIYASRRGYLEPVTRESATDPSVDATAFAAALSGIIPVAIEDAYQTAASIAEDLVSVYPTPKQLQELYIDDMGVASDEAGEVPEGQEYPKTGVAGNRVKLPKPVKIGLYMDVTLEAITDDQTASRLDAAKAVGDGVAYDWRKRILKVVLGIVNNFWRNGSTYSTYNASSPWANKLTDFDQSNGPAEFDRLDTLFDSMTDPITGREITIGGNRQMIVPRSNLLRTRSTVRTQEVRTTDGNTLTVTGNPVGGLPEPNTDPLIRRLLSDAGFNTTQIASMVFYGDFKEAFARRMVREFEVLERDNELASDVGFRQDIVYAAKGRVWGVPFARRPWMVTQGYKAS